MDTPLAVSIARLVPADFPVGIRSARRLRVADLAKRMIAIGPSWLNRARLTDFSSRMENSLRFTVTIRPWSRFLAPTRECSASITSRSGVRAIRSRKISGQGTVGFSDCTFVEWKNERAAIQISAGSVLIRGCEFCQSKAHISIGEGVDRAVITGNLFAGPAQIRNAATKDVQIGLNAAL